MIFCVVYYYYLEPITIGKTIGYDWRYNIFIFWSPTIIGIITLGIYRRNFLINRFSTNKGLALWTFMILFYLAQGLMFSYLSFGQIANVTWGIINKKTAEQNPIEIFQCEVTKFRTHKGPSFDFKFKGVHESIRVNYETIKEYKDKNPNNYIIEIEGRKGIWNHYILNSWILKEK